MKAAAEVLGNGGLGSAYKVAMVIWAVCGVRRRDEVVRWREEKLLVSKYIPKGSFYAQNRQGILCMGKSQVQQCPLEHNHEPMLSMLFTSDEPQQHNFIMSPSDLHTEEFTSMVKVGKVVMVAVQLLHALGRSLQILILQKKLWWSRKGERFCV